MKFARIAVSVVLLWGSANDVTAGREADEQGDTGTSPSVARAKHAPEPASVIQPRNRGDHLASPPHASTFPDEGRLVTNRHEIQRRNDANDRHKKYNRHRRSSPQPHLNDSAQPEHIETPRIQARRPYKNVKQAPDDRNNPLTEEESRRPEALDEEGRLRTITSTRSSHQAESQEGPETHMRQFNHREQDAITHILPDHSEAKSMVKRQRRRLRRRSRQQQENQHNMHTHAHLHHRHAVSEEVATDTSTAHDESSSADTNNDNKTSSPIPTQTLSSHPSLLAQDILLVRGHQTHLCWTVDNGRYDTGTLIILDECNAANPRQYFVRENYSYDVETDSYSWLWRPVGWELLESDSDDTSTTSRKSQSNTRKSTFYVVGHKYTISAESVDSKHEGRWRMVLDELPEGVTDPLTQVFWTIGSPSPGHDIVRTTISSSYSDLESNIDVDIMGMGQHAYSTRLFVANEGDVAEVDAPVVLRTETSIHEAVERARTLARTPIRHGLDQFEEEVYQLNGHDEDNEPAVNTGATMVDGGTVAGVIPGKWSYIRVA